MIKTFTAFLNEGKYDERLYRSKCDDYDYSLFNKLLDETGKQICKKENITLANIPEYFKIDKQLLFKNRASSEAYKCSILYTRIRLDSDEKTNDPEQNPYRKHFNELFDYTQIMPNNTIKLKSLGHYWRRNKDIIDEIDLSQKKINFYIEGPDTYSFSAHYSRVIIGIMFFSYFEDEDLRKTFLKYFIATENSDALFLYNTTPMHYLALAIAEHVFGSFHHYDLLGVFTTDNDDFPRFVLRAEEKFENGIDFLIKYLYYFIELTESSLSELYKSHQNDFDDVVGAIIYEVNKLDQKNLSDPILIKFLKETYKILSSTTFNKLYAVLTPEKQKELRKYQMLNKYKNVI